MGTWGLEPLENDSALDFIDEFLDVESPARSIRAALATLNKGGYNDIDVVAHAWAACELVAIASTGGEGYDPDDVAYEAAARLRPNKTLIGQCLDALPRVLGEDSELSELVNGEQRGEVEQAIASTRVRLESALELDKFPRLQVPKVKAVHTYAVPVGDKWMVGLSDYVYLTLLDTVYDDMPASFEEASVAEARILLRCRYIGAIDELDALGRFRPSGAAAEPGEFVTILRYACTSGSDMGDFETNYWLDRGNNPEQVGFEEAGNYPYCPELTPDALLETLQAYVTDGSLDLPPLPTPRDLREEFLGRCREEWAPYLEGDGGGPFSFPHVYALDPSPYAQYWINFHLRKNWTNSGMCLPDDLTKYFLTGLVAACVGAYPGTRVPNSLRGLVGDLRTHVNRRIIGATIHTLARLLDESSVIPYVLQEDPPRRADFLEQASHMRSELEAIVAAD